MKTLQFVLPTIAAAIIVPVAFSYLDNFQQGSQPPSMEQLYPGPLGTANFGRMIYGKFTDNVTLDAALMDGHTAKMLPSPEIYQCAVTISANVNDIAPLPGVVPGKDLILTVSAAGLKRHERKQDWSNQITPTWWESAVIFDSASGWGGALLVETGNFDGDAHADVVGVGSDGHSLLIGYGNGDGTFDPGTTLTLPVSTIYEILPLNFRENGEVPGAQEIAVSTNAGPCVLRAADGTFLWSTSWTTSIVRFAAIASPGSPTQKLASIAALNGIDWLSIVTDGQATQGPYSLGQGQICTVTSGDLNGDGYSDLVMGNTTENKVVVRTNSGGTTPMFPVANQVKYAHGAQGRDPSLNHAENAVADFDGDGKLDIFAPAQGTLTGPQAVFGQVSLVTPNGSHPDWFHANITFAIYFADTNTMRFTIERPTAQIPIPQGGSRRLRIRGHHQDELAAYPNRIPYIDTWIDVPITPTVTWDMQLPEDFDPTVDPDAFSMVLTQEGVDGNGAVVSVRPSVTGIFSGHGTFEVVSSTSNAQLIVPNTNIPIETPPSGGWDLGPTVPGSEPDKEPKE